MSLSTLEKNLSKWNGNCRNNWVNNSREKQIEKTLNKIEFILDKAWKDHIKQYVKWELEIPYYFDIEEYEYGITLKDINVIDDLGKVVSFKNKKYQVCVVSYDGNIFDKRLRVTVYI